MSVPRALAILVACLMGGCASGGAGGQNPNLLAPKLVVQQRADGNVTLFVHGAFHDQVYDWVAVEVDNATVDNRTDAFSIETHAPGPGFFVTVEAQSGAQYYALQARLDVNATAERVRVAVLDQGEWGDARSFGLPFERILDRPKVTA